MRGGAAALLRSLLLIPEGVKPSVRVREIPSSLVSHPLSSQGVIDTNRARNDSSIVNFDVHTVSSLFLVKKKTLYIRPCKVISSTMCSNSDNILETWHHPAMSTFQTPYFRVWGCGNFRVHSCGSRLLIPHGNVVLRHSSEDWLTKMTLIPQITQ